jgi:hypothetical protein
LQGTPKRNYRDCPGQHLCWQRGKKG